MAGRGADGAGGEAARHRKGWRGSGRLLLCCPLGIGAEFNSKPPIYTCLLAVVFALACGRMQLASLQLLTTPALDAASATGPTGKRRRTCASPPTTTRWTWPTRSVSSNRADLPLFLAGLASPPPRALPHMAIPQVHASLRTCMHMQCCLLRAVILPAWGVGHRLLLRAAFQSSIRCA